MAKRCKIAGLKYPASDHIENRASTITRSMACSLDPREACSDEDEKMWLEKLGQDKDNLTCAYCGRKATHLDHLMPLIVDKKPSGWISTPGNLVPCCSTCNQKKRNMNYRSYMESNKCDHVDNNCQSRIERIEAMTKCFSPQKQDWVKDPNFIKDWTAAQKCCFEALSKAQELLNNYIKK